MGKPVITTNWSGPTAYINEQVAYPLSVDHLTAADADMNSTVFDEKEINIYFNGQQWAQPNITHLKQLMRQVSAFSTGCRRGRSCCVLLMTICTD